MGASMNIVGFRPPDEKWRQMKKVWDACREANISVPQVVTKFFGDKDPDDAGVEVSLDPERCDAVKIYNESEREGYEVDIAALPAGMRYIRFFMSY